MALDRQGTGFVILRLFIGVFFLFEGLGKIRWFTDTSILSGVLGTWSQAAPAGSTSAWYLSNIAMPGVPIFARLVPLAELLGGLALIVGFWTPLVAFLAFFMVLNIHVASGAIFKYSFLTNGYGLPVLGGTLALAFGGVRLRWSLR